MNMSTYGASTEAENCCSAGAGVFSAGVAGFESSSSSCFKTTCVSGAAASCGLSAALPAFPAPRPVLRARVVPPLPFVLPFGGIVSVD